MKMLNMFKKLLPRNWGSNVPVRRDAIDRVGIFAAFDCAFEDFWSGTVVPSLSVAETDKDLVVQVKLPKMKRKDIELSIADGTLTIRGEHRQQREKNRWRSYSYQSSVSVFHGSIPLPDGIDLDHIEAHFKRGVLRVILPKMAEARERVRRIPVTVEA